MRARASYIITQKSPPEEPLELRDVGPWDLHPTITNDAEAVVEDLAAAGLLWNGRRLFYEDSDGQKDEICHADGKFTGFRAGTQ